LDESFPQKLNEAHNLPNFKEMLIAVSAEKKTNHDYRII